MSPGPTPWPASSPASASTRSRSSPNVHERPGFGLDQRRGRVWVVSEDVEWAMVAQDGSGSLDRPDREPSVNKVGAGNAIRLMSRIMGDLSQAWIDRDVSWLEFNRRVLQEAFDERNPLLGAGQVPRDLLVEPGRVLPEADGDRPPAARGRQSGREGAPRAVRPQAGDDRLDARAAGGVLRGGAAAAAGRARNPSGGLGRPHRRPARGGVVAVSAGGAAGPDAAEPGRCPSVSVRLEPVDVVGLPARRSGQRRVGAGAGQGAERAAAVGAGAGRREPRRSACSWGSIR